MNYATLIHFVGQEESIQVDGSELLVVHHENLSKSLCSFTVSNLKLARRYLHAERGKAEALV